MIRNGVKFEQAGKSYKEIVSILRTYPDQTEMYLLPESFEQLKRSGRVSTPQAIFASLLNINLLLRFKDGKVIVEERIRTKKRAKLRLFEIIADAEEMNQLKEICVMHRSEEHTSELQSRGHLVCRLLLEKKIKI